MALESYRSNRNPKKVCKRKLSIVLEKARQLKRRVTDPIALTAKNMARL